KKKRRFCTATGGYLRLCDSVVKKADRRSVKNEMTLFLASLLREGVGLNFYCVRKPDPTDFWRRSRLRMPGILQQSHQRQHEQENHAHDPKRFDKREHGGVLLYQPIDCTQRFARGGDAVGAHRDEMRAHALEISQ